MIIQGLHSLLDRYVVLTKQDRETVLYIYFDKV